MVNGGKNRESNYLFLIRKWGMEYLLFRRESDIKKITLSLIP